MKDDGGKPNYILVPMSIVDAIEKVREFGLQKYKDPENWKTVEVDRYWQAFLRHVRAAWSDPSLIDPESGLPHIWHAACNLAFIIELSKED